MTLRRRTLLQAGAAGATATLAGFASPVFAQAKTKLRVGYLHTPAVDGQIFIGQQSGAWAKHGLELELRQFTTGLELFQAMIGGSLDVLSTGAARARSFSSTTSSTRPPSSGCATTRSSRSPT